MLSRFCNRVCVFFLCLAFSLAVHDSVSWHLSEAFSGRQRTVRAFAQTICGFVVLVVGLGSGCLVARALGAETPKPADEAAVQGLSAQFVEAFNKGDAKAIAALVLPQAEVIDDAGNYLGTEEIQAIFAKFFEKFPGATMGFEAESIRLIGSNLAVEDGVRSVAIPKGEEGADTRYTIVYVSREGRWLIASAREYAEDLPPTPHELLEPLAWMVGEWVDESPEALILMSVRWSEDQNFLLADFTVKSAGETVLQTNQRVGWNPLTQSPRSWSFDSDGGCAEGVWTVLDGGWLIKSTSVLADGQIGSATIEIKPDSPEKFTMLGRDRVRGGVAEEDFEVTVVRQPPQPAK